MPRHRNLPLRYRSPFANWWGPILIVVAIVGWLVWAALPILSM